MRNLYSVNNPCQAGCAYCFAKWKDIYTGQPSLETANIDNEGIILYPCCDGELFDQTGVIDKIKDISKDSKKIYVSISTKRMLNQKEFNNILTLNQWLNEHNKGFVKFSVSVSTKTKICEIERSTADYSDRLLLAQKLMCSNIHSSLTLKPVLPFIPSKEYIEIINDFSPYVKYITLGGLYINPKSKFYTEYIQDKYSFTKRKVCWLDNNPDWYYIEDNKKTQQLIEYASNRGIQVHLSDEDLIKSIINQMG